MFLVISCEKIPNYLKSGKKINKNAEIFLVLCKDNQSSLATTMQLLEGTEFFGFKK